MDGAKGLRVAGESGQTPERGAIFSGMCRQTRQLFRMFFACFYTKNRLGSGVKICKAHREAHHNVKNAVSPWRDGV
jgi:hypothetical protein